MTEIVHKVVFDLSRNGSFHYQLCHGVNNTNSLLSDQNWENNCRYQWKFVTCKVCLSLKGVKKPKAIKFIETKEGV